METVLAMRKAISTSTADCFTRFACKYEFSNVCRRTTEEKKNLRKRKNSNDPKIKNADFLCFQYSWSGERRPLWQCYGQGYVQQKTSVADNHIYGCSGVLGRCSRRAAPCLCQRRSESASAARAVATRLTTPSTEPLNTSLCNRHKLSFLPATVFK